jgi:beta-glucosidase/6-phospho-beta-glucosidase/beta-galactosidase
MSLTSLREESIQQDEVKNPFNSFWMAGYECTDQQNAFGNRVDFLHITGHYDLLDQDYAHITPFNLYTVREGLRWSQVEKTAYQYDWSTLKIMLEKGRRHRIQQVWDICHFGFPDDLTPLHPMFARRFAAFCRAFVNFYRSIDPYGELVVTPVNEVSFISWLGGDARGTSPYCWGQGWEVKYALMRAYIEGTAAMREIDPSIRFLTTEPLINVVPPLDADEHQIREAEWAHENQFQAVDMLTGRMCPELGGSPDYLDILGFNFYYDNQWQFRPNQVLPWRNLVPDPRWRPLRSLLRDAYNRYEKPFVITETSHSGEDRPLWIEFVANEAAAVLEEGLPLLGICIYPIIDRPDWDHLDKPWHASGLWDAESIPVGKIPARILNLPYAMALKDAQEVISETQSVSQERSII